MRVSILALATALGVLLPAWGQVSTASDRQAVLKFGIETEVLELVRALRQEKNVDYRDQLIAAYEGATSDELKEALLLFFLDLKDKGLETQAVAEIAAGEKKGNSLLLNAVTYLTEVHSDQVKDTLVTLTSGKNKILALASIRALGKLGAVDKVDDLLKLYQDGETDPNFKPDLIWAFGEMKAAAAVDLMLKEYEDNESQPLLRRSLLEALGKVGDGKAWDLVQAALADKNTDIRSAAVATLASYPGHGDPLSLLTTALKDAQPGVRAAAAQAAKVAKLPGLKDLLTYRVKKDPDPKVKVEALRALSAYDDGPSVVLGFLGERKGDMTVWQEALKLSLDKKYPGTFDVLKKVVEEDVKDKTANLSVVISGATLPQRDAYRALYGLILASDKAGARTSALRAIALGKFTEFEGLLRTLEAKDPDPGVKAQAKKILQDWGLEKPDEKAPVSGKS